MRKAESKKQRDKDFELFGKKDLTKVCDSDSRWAAGQSLRPQSFVIIVGVQFIEPEDIIKLRV